MNRPIRRRMATARERTSILWRASRWALPRLAAAAALVFLACWFLFPFPEDGIGQLDACAVTTDRHGEVLRVRLDRRDQRCLPIRIDQAGHWLPLALMSAEDKRFASHPGVDPLATVRAAAQNTVHMTRVSGASTISTQVIRLAEPRPRTIRTKVIEYFRALQMETRLTKPEIMEAYLNRTPYGGNLVGARAASLAYFGKEPAHLGLEEAALLAGLPQSPSRLRPDLHPDAARKRRDFVLQRMRANGHLDEARCAAALAEPIRLTPGDVPFLAPHFCDLIGDRGPGRTRTTLDLGLQTVCEHVLRQESDAWRGLGADGAAAVVLHVPSGELRVMIGAPDHGANPAGQVNAALAPRSPGSALKPFVYTMAFDQGRLTPDQILHDRAANFAGYRPGNFDRAHRGEVRARDALRHSLNLPALRLLQDIGVDSGLQALRRLGLDTLDQDPGHYGLNLVLGGGETRLLDLANAYACLARGGQWLPPRLTMDAERPSPVRWCSPEAAWMVAQCLEGTEPESGARVAWKTGTSSRHRDAWTIAWNPTWVVGVWMGRTDGGAVDERFTGRAAATPLALRLFARALGTERGPDWFERPSGIVERPCCAASGRPLGPDCEREIDCPAIEHVSDPAPCAHHQASRAALAQVFRIDQPRPGERVLRVDGGETLRLQSNRPAHWFIDGEPLGHGRELLWPLRPGPARIVAVADDGARDEANIVVAQPPTR